MISLEDQISRELEIPVYTTSAEIDLTLIWAGRIRQVQLMQEPISEHLLDKVCALVACE